MITYAKIELAFYLIVGAVAFGARYRLSGIKNAAFYAKGDTHADSRVRYYVENIHRAEDPASKISAAMAVALVMATMRAVGVGLLLSLVASLLFTKGAFWMGAPFHQKWINRGTSLPDYDPGEKRQIDHREGIYKVFFVGRLRRAQPIAGALLVGAALYILLT